MTGWQTPTHAPPTSYQEAPAAVGAWLRRRLPAAGSAGYAQSGYGQQQQYAAPPPQHEEPVHEQAPRRRRPSHLRPSRPGPQPHSYQFADPAAPWLRADPASGRAGLPGTCSAAPGPAPAAADSGRAAGRAAVGGRRRRGERLRDATGAQAGRRTRHRPRGDLRHRRRRPDPQAGRARGRPRQARRRCARLCPDGVHEQAPQPAEAGAVEPPAEPAPQAPAVPAQAGPAPAAPAPTAPAPAAAPPAAAPPAAAPPAPAASTRRARAPAATGVARPAAVGQPAGRALCQARDHRAALPRSPGHRPADGRVAADVGSADDGGRGRRDLNSEASRPDESQLRSTRRREAIVPPVLRASRDRSAQGASDAERESSIPRTERSPTTTPSIWASRSTPTAA